jgi:hypothetical protein
MRNLGHASIIACALASSVTLACESQDGPCAYQEQALSADSPTPWGTIVGTDFAALLGPRDGVWTWSSSTINFDIDDEGTTFPAQANLVVDPMTYTLTQHVGGGRGVACRSDEISAEGRLSFVDEAGATFVDIPVEVVRTPDEPNYLATWLISPVSDFSVGLHPKIELAEEFVRGFASWSVDGGELYAVFGYAGQTLQMETGHGVISTVAEFQTPGVRP